MKKVMCIDFGERMREKKSKAATTVTIRSGTKFFQSVPLFGSVSLFYIPAVFMYFTLQKSDGFDDFFQRLIAFTRAVKHRF